MNQTPEIIWGEIDPLPQIQDISELNDGWLQSVADDLMVKFGFTNQQIVDWAVDPNERIEAYVAMRLGRIDEWRAYVHRIVRSRRSRYHALQHIIINSNIVPFVRVGERLARTYGLDSRHIEQLATVFREKLEESLVRILGAKIRREDCGDDEIRARPILANDIGYCRSFAISWTTKLACAIARNNA